jgi:hypothetical protein
MWFFAAKYTQKTYCRQEKTCRGRSILKRSAESPPVFRGAGARENAATGARGGRQ